MKASSSPRAAFTLTEIMIVVAIISLLAVIAIPNYIASRQKGHATTCINNLRQIDSAVQQWALEGNQGASASVTKSDVKPYMGRSGVGLFPQCPSGGTYTLTTVQEKPTCTIGQTFGPPYFHELSQ